MKRRDFLKSLLAIPSLAVASKAIVPESKTESIGVYNTDKNIYEFGNFRVTFPAPANGQTHWALYGGYGEGTPVMIPVKKRK